MLASLAARSFQQQLRHTAAAAAPPWPRMAQAMAGAGAGPGLDAQKRQVREEVKRALRQLSAEQMAEESEWPQAGGGVVGCWRPAGVLVGANRRLLGPCRHA